MLTLRRFNKYDWYGWAGAERYHSGGEPFIGQIKMIDPNYTNEWVIVIVDAHNVGMYYTSSTADGPDDCDYDTYFNVKEQMDLLDRLKDEMTPKELAEVFVTFKRQPFPPIAHATNQLESLV